MFDGSVSSITERYTVSSPTRVTDADIRAWDGLIAATATRLAGTQRARRAGAELDDLIQEGRLAVFLSILRGVNPGMVIENRMKDYVKWVGRRNDAVPYEAALPVEAPLGGEG